MHLRPASHTHTQTNKHIPNLELSQQLFQLIQPILQVWLLGRLVGVLCGQNHPSMLQKYLDGGKGLPETVDL